MKKFLKVFIVVLLVIGVVAGTTYFFFRNVEKKDNTTASIAALLQSEEKLKFNSDLRYVSGLMNSDGTDQRLNLIIATNEKLDEIVNTLSTYFVHSNTKINDEALSNKLKQVQSNRKILTAMMNEYNIKKDSPLFNRHLGANDLYVKGCSYLITYAEFANILNEKINVNKESDIKFNMFEIYSNVVLDTFAWINANEVDRQRVVVDSSSNIDVMNSVLKIRSSYVVKIENENTPSEKVEMLFDINTNLFNDYYEKCDENSFAHNLAENLNLSTSPIQPNNERNAAYYFNLIYGI
ncbi:MAG: hypothetical protein IJW36_01250 [Clostridia bacterium]|nr:hypothetical protein [Clostridia bacterium]